MGGGFYLTSRANGFAIKTDWTGQVLDQVGYLPLNCFHFLVKLLSPVLSLSMSTITRINV